MANVRLVAHVAKRYHDRGIPPGDLIQEGFCALLVAIDRFDVVNETRLATYAIWWIRQAIQRAVAGGAYPVRLNPRQLHQLAQAQAMFGGGGNDTERTTRSDPPSAGALTVDRAGIRGHPPGALARRPQPVRRVHDRSANFSSRRTRKIHRPTTPIFRWAT